ncbi:MAG: hypothetical protein ACI9TH_004718 [Kiritimatiellia bacterium]|jgi:hypothetical protein
MLSSGSFHVALTGFGDTFRSMFMRPDSLFVLLLFLPLSVLQAQSLDLADYEAHFTNNLARIDQSHPDPTIDASKQYNAQLLRLEQTHQSQGQLEAVLSCRKEIDRFALETSVPAEVPEGFSRNMRKIHYRYFLSRRNGSQARNQRLAALLNSYSGALDDLEKRQVKAGQIDRAKRTRVELNKINDLQDHVLEDMGQINTAFASVHQAMEELMAARTQTNRFAPGSRLPPTLLRDRVLHYTFDRDEPDKVSDQSGKRHHGESHGANWVRQGKIGGGIEVDFNSTYVTIPTDTLGNWEALSYAVWVKVPSYSGSAWPSFIGASTTSHDVNISIGIAQSTGTLYAEVDTEGGNAPIHRGKMPLPWDTWFHAAIVYDGETLTEYVNGEPGASLPASGALKTVRELHLGRGSKMWNPTSSLIGQLDEVIIFDRALSASEVKAIYQAQK